MENPIKSDSESLWPAARLLLRDAWTLGPGRMLLVGTLTVVQGLIDGFAMALLFPLIALLGLGGTDGPFVRAIVDAIGAIGLEANIATILAILVGAVAVQNALVVWQIWATAGFTQAIAANLKMRLWSAYLAAQWQFFAKERMSNLLSAVANVDRASNAMVYMTQFAATAVVTCVYISLALVAAWQVSLLLLLMAAVSFALTRGVLRHAKRVGARAHHAVLELNAISTETLRSMKLVKGTGGEAVVKTGLFPVIAESVRLQARTVVHPTVIRATYEMIAISTIALILVAATQYGVFESATVLAVLVVFIRVYPRLTTLQQFIHGVAINLPSVPHCYEVLADAERHAERPADGTMRAAPPEGAVDIRLAGVTVRYGEKTALDGIDLDIPWGKMVAIVGSSGAGKTTLVDSILGIAPVASGEVVVSGVPLSRLSLAAWRRRIGYVGQDTILFNASIRSNLLWTEADRSEADVMRALGVANAAGFVAELEKGIDTEVGDNGVRMSGGQRQRIGLARALIAPRALLILDEATSALDSTSEEPIIRAIRSLKGSMSILVVAHRLVTVRHADEIVVLQDGRVVERGGWEELVARDGEFARIWRLQNEARSEAAQAP